MYKEIPARVSPLEYLDEFERINEERRQEDDEENDSKRRRFLKTFLPAEIIDRLSPDYMDDKEDDFPRFLHIYDEDKKLCEIYDELMEKMENYNTEEMKNFLEDSIDYINGYITNTSPLNGYDSEEIEKITEIFNDILYRNDEDLLREISYIIVKYKYTEKFKKEIINYLFKKIYKCGPLNLKKCDLREWKNPELSDELEKTAKNINILLNKIFGRPIDLIKILQKYDLEKIRNLIDIMLEFIYAEEKEPLKKLILFISQNSRRSGYLVEDLPQNMAADIVERDDVEAFDVYENLPADVVEYSPAVSVWGGS